MLTVSCSLRPSDSVSVPALFGVLGIVSPLPAVPPGGVLGSASARSSVPTPRRAPPIVGAVEVYHPHNTHRNERRPSRHYSSNAHQTLYTPPGGPIFLGTGIPSGGIA